MIHSSELVMDVSGTDSLILTVATGRKKNNANCNNLRGGHRLIKHPLPTRPTDKNKLSSSTKVWFSYPPRLPSETELVCRCFVSKYHHAICLYYLSIQCMSAFDAKTESNLNVHIDAGGDDRQKSVLQFRSQVPSHSGD